MTQTPVSKGARAARAASRVSTAVLMSRLLGLVREQVFAKMFGASLFMDAWLVAFRLPNLLRDLFAEGALSSAFMPTFASTLKQGGREAAFRLVNLVLGSLMVVLGVLTVVLFAGADFFTVLFAPGYAEVAGKPEVTAALIRIMSPFLLMVAMAAVAMGALNSFDRFFLPALAPAFFNLALILSGLLLAPQFESWGVLPIYAMGVGALLGGALQFGVQLPLLYREGFRLRPALDWADAGVRRMARLMGPAMVGMSAVQINILINTILASFLQDNGPVSWLSYAFRVIYLPIGVFGVAVAVVNLKEVSAQAASRQWDEVRETVANSLRLVSLLAFPSMIGLLVLARPVISVLYERGAFTRVDTTATAWALMAYSAGLLAYSAVKVYGPTFYAMDDTATPVRASVTAVATNLTVNVVLLLLLPEGYRFIGLALGTSTAAITNWAILAIRFRKRVGSLSPHSVSATVVRCGVASIGMGAFVWWLHPVVASAIPGTHFPADVLQLLVTVLAGACSYLLMARFLGVAETHYVTDLFSRRRS